MSDTHVLDFFIQHLKEIGLTCGNSAEKNNCNFIITLSHGINGIIFTKSKGTCTPDKKT